MSQALSQFPSFQIHGNDSIAPRWTKYLERFENLMVGFDIKDNARKGTLLLQYAGEEIYYVFGTLPNRGDNEAYDVAKAALNKHFIPKRNTT